MRSFNRRKCCPLKSIISTEKKRKQCQCYWFSFWWDCHGIIILEYLLSTHGVNRDTVLQCLNSTIDIKRTSCKRKLPETHLFDIFDWLLNVHEPISDLSCEFGIYMMLKKQRQIFSTYGSNRYFQVSQLHPITMQYLSCRLTCVRVFVFDLDCVTLSPRSRDLTEPEFTQYFHMNL